MTSESPTHPDAPRAGGETPALLPCPFCGHPPYVSRSANGTEMLFVGCAVCGIEFKSAWYRDAGNPTRDIVAAWNRRASLLERHRDGERLDWLDDQDGTVTVDLATMPGAGRVVRCSTTLEWRQFAHATPYSIREVIDNAMSAPPSPERASK